MKSTLLVMFSICILATPAAAAPRDGKLEGGFYLSSESCGEDGKAPNCKMTFELKGAAAKTMYDNMRVKAKLDICTEGPVKDDGNGLRCYKRSANRYECDFGYQFSKRKFTISDVSC